MYVCLGVSYNMDHEAVPRLYKICDWLLNLSQDHFGLHQGKNVRVTMKFKVPKRHILRPTLSTDMFCNGRDKKMCSNKKKGKGPWY